MNCGDFKRLINEQLDVRAAASADVERAWESHGSACPECRAEARRYQILRRAIGAWGTPPAPPADFSDRFLLAWEQSGAMAAAAPGRGRRSWRYWPVAMPLAAAAALLLMFLPGVRQRESARPRSAPLARAGAIDPDALSDALAEVTSATWDLARATSAPAARVGLDVLDAGEFSESGASLSLAMPPEDRPASEDSWDERARFIEGIRPLSGTARHAFGFLLGPDPPKPEASPSSSTGA
jgi:hypothetical protein